MKKLLLAALSIMITLAPVQKAHGVAGVVMAIGGVTSAGTVALAGLASPFVGIFIGQEADEEWGGVSGFMIGSAIGLILLDEEQGSVTFNKVKAEQAGKLALTEDQIEIYNSEIEEANILFEEVASNLTAESSVEESRAVWNEMQDFVSAETIEVMQSLISKR